MRLILVRHGKSVANEEGWLAGSSKADLSSLGREQANKLGERLKKEKIDVMYSSPQSRALQTAEIISGKIGLKFELIEDLREGAFGEAEGEMKSDLDWEAVMKEHLEGVENPRYGESLIDLRKRAQKVFHMLLHKHPDATVLCVAHIRINKAMIGEIEGIGNLELRARGKLENASFTIYEIDEDKNHKLHVFNSTEHLIEN